MVVTFWVLMAFAIPGHEFQVDEFKFSTQSGCELAKMRMTTAVDALNIKCVMGRETRNSDNR